MVNYCVGHWKSVVESKKEFARQVVQHAKAQEKIRLSRPKKRLVKKKVKG